ncbi:UNVERIFIED_CONTAM: hypothetical protein LK11_22735 [Mumia flava]
MAVLVAVFAGGTWYGVRLLVSDPPGLPEAGADLTCRNRTLESGEQLTAREVRVNVLNASGASGIANRTMINLEARGFQPGEIGNATEDTKVKNVQIVARRPNRVDARLVAAQFKGKKTYQEGTPEGEATVLVIVGDDYKGLRKKAKAPQAMKAKNRVTICVPQATPVDVG